LRHAFSRDGFPQHDSGCQRDRQRDQVAIAGLIQARAWGIGLGLDLIATFWPAAFTATTPATAVTAFTVTAFTVTAFTITAFTITAFAVAAFAVTAFAITAFAVAAFAVAAFAVAAFAATAIASFTAAPTGGVIAFPAFSAVGDFIQALFAFGTARPTLFTTAAAAASPLVRRATTLVIASPVPAL
jgi:hypothetical protein